MDSANALLINTLAARYGEKFSLAVISVKQNNQSFDTEVSARKIHALPTPFSYAGGFVNTFRFYSILKKIASENDVLIVQLPFIGFLALPFIHKRVVYHVCANVLTAAANPVKYTGIRRLASGFFAGLLHRVYHTLFSRKYVQVITNGNELGALYKKYSPQAVISSSLHEHDIIDEDKIIVSTQTPLRVLFVGRPSLEKGFDTLIESLCDLPKEFRLAIVGFTIEEFRQLLPDVFERSKPYHSKLDFKGYLGWSNGLKNIIQENDIAIVPSRSEGTPRVVLECMSQGVPVIASRIGGIPTVIQDTVNGLLVEPGNVQDLRQKIMFLSNDLECRKKLISCGIRTASENTITQFSSHFIRAVEQLSNE